MATQNGYEKHSQCGYPSMMEWAIRYSDGTAGDGGGTTWSWYNDQQSLVASQKGRDAVTFNEFLPRFSARFVRIYAKVGGYDGTDCNGCSGGCTASGAQLSSDGSETGAIGLTYSRVARPSQCRMLITSSQA